MSLTNHSLLLYSSTNLACCKSNCTLSAGDPVSGPKWKPLMRAGPFSRTSEHVSLSRRNPTPPIYLRPPTSAGGNGRGWWAAPPNAHCLITLFCSEPCLFLCSSMHGAEGGLSMGVLTLRSDQHFRSLLATRHCYCESRPVCCCVLDVLTRATSSLGE